MRCLFVFDFFFYHLAAKLIGPRMGCQFFKNVDFSVECPLNSVCYVKRHCTLVEIIFVGRCEVFAYL